MNQKTLVISLSIMIVGLSPISPISRVFAEEIIISANGSDSNNTTEVTIQSQTNVTQNNTANVTNNTNANLDTGNNNASNNKGDVAIQTGNATANVSVENTANVSVVDTNSCCMQAEGEKKIVVSGNGAGSQNNVNASHAVVTTTTITQNAVITNAITGSAITGNNKANNNSGNVTIKTGSINVHDSIKTGPVNFSSISVSTPSTGYEIFIKNNGSDSINSVKTGDIVTIENTIYNRADIFNSSVWDLISGGNTANNNNGDVIITTGDIDQSTSIENAVNVSSVTVECCKDKATTPTPTPVNPPSPTPDGGKGGGSGSSDGGSSGSSNGSSLAAVGRILPATGANWIFFALLANTVMLLLGWVLRLRSGRSPAYSFHVAF